MARRVLTLLWIAAFLPLLSAEDWSGKLIMLKTQNVQLGHRTETGLLLTGNKLGIACAYKVRKDDGSYLELVGKKGLIFKMDAILVDNAPAYYTQKIQTSPGSPGWYGMRGIAFLYKGRNQLEPSSKGQNAGEYELALADFNQVIRQAPDNPIWWNWRGYLFLERRDFQRAVDDFTEAVRLSPTTPSLYVDRAMARTELKQYAKAQADLSRAIQLNPQYAEAYLARGNVWMRQKKYEKAAADYLQVNSLNPQNYSSIYNLGLVHFAQKQWEDALIQFDKALQFDPHCVRYLMSRGKTLKELKRYEQAVEDFNKVLAVDARNTEAFHQRSHVWHALRKYDKAMFDLKQALQLNPKDARLMNCLAWMLATHPEDEYRDSRRALALAQQVVANFGDSFSWRYHGTLAAAYAASGNFPKAIAHQKEAIEMIILQDKQSTDEDLQQANQRLRLYQEGKSYRDK